MLEVLTSWGEVGRVCMEKAELAPKCLCGKPRSHLELALVSSPCWSQMLPRGMVEIFIRNCFCRLLAVQGICQTPSEKISNRHPIINYLPCSR